MLSLSVFEFKAMGSPCALRLYADNGEQAAVAMHAAAKEINRLEEKYSRYKNDNLLARVNAIAGTGGRIEVDDEFSTLLDFADTCYQESDGLFDITSGVLRKAWDFRSGQLPEPSAIDALRSAIGWQYVQREGNVLTFLHNGMELDFGGIVKEYAVDRAAAICRDHGIHYGLVDMGGDVHVIGPHPDGKPWLIRIRHPRDSNQSLGVIALQRGGLASSGDYERCITLNNERYCHVLSPATGWPVRGIAAVSVVASQCVLAGSICTMTMLKERQGIEFLQELGVDFLAMDIDENAFQVQSPQLCEIVMAS